jgi:hypothetical protein
MRYSDEGDLLLIPEIINHNVKNIAKDSIENKEYHFADL